MTSLHFEHSSHRFLSKLPRALPRQAAGRLMDCTSGEAGRHRRGHRGPHGGCRQAMRAGIVEFGGVQEEEEEENPENPENSWDPSERWDWEDPLWGHCMN